VSGVIRRSSSPAPPADSLGRLPHAAVVDRPTFLIELATGRRVIDLGFVDRGRTDSKRAHGEWLHERLAAVSSAIVGIDADEQGVEEARRRGLDARLADCQDADSLAALALEPAELIIAGELIEHLDAPGVFLRAIRPLVAADGMLAITTPNPLALTNVLLGLARREVQNVDHVGWQSWRTLDTLLERNGWRTERLAFYMHPRYVSPAGAPRGIKARTWTFNTYQTLATPLFMVAPSTADGLIVVARRAGDPE